MRFILMLALLAFPILEIWILISLAHDYGWWLMLYLIVIAMLGIQLIREEKALLSGHMLKSLTEGGHPIKAIFGSARNMIAGVLLIIPGIMTDVIAAILLMIPLNNTTKSSAYKHQNAANDDVIEGEFHRED